MKCIDNKPLDPAVIWGIVLLSTMVATAIVTGIPILVVTLLIVPVPILVYWISKKPVEAAVVLALILVIYKLITMNT